MLKVSTLIDVIQETEGDLTLPEIRVWTHPHKIGLSGDDEYQVFGSFELAHEFIKSHPEAEDNPLIAFKGHEINIYSN